MACRLIGANIVNWTLGNKFQWNFHQNTTIFHSRKCVWKCCLEMAAILSRPQCVLNNLSVTRHFYCQWYYQEHAFSRVLLVINELSEIQLMVWCSQATSHYMNKCWSRSLMHCHVIWRQWCIVMSLGGNDALSCHLETMMHCHVTCSQWCIVMSFRDNDALPCHLETMMHCHVTWRQWCIVMPLGDNDALSCRLETMVHCHIT